MYYGNRGRSVRMETSALVLGIISIASCTCIYLSIVAGAMAILFAFLSKGEAVKMGSKAKIALILGIIGVAFTVILYASSLFVTLTEFGSLENLLRLYCDMMGVDFDQMYGAFF